VHRLTVDDLQGRTARAAYADMLERAHRELHNARLALDDTDEARARYAQALATYDQVQGMFPFTAGEGGNDA
jgi:hypothetical protein